MAALGVVWYGKGMKSQLSTRPSLQEANIVNLLRTHPEVHYTNHELTRATKAAGRTVRLHTLRLVKRGLLECITVFGGFRYRWRSEGEQRNAAYIKQLDQAIQVLGVK